MSQPTGTVGVFTYTLVSVSDNNGCSQSQSGSAAITVNAPLITSVIATPSAICLGGSSNLVVSAPTGGATTIVNYDFNSGTSFATLAPTLASGITSTVSGTAVWGTTAGSTATVPNAFTANPTAGNAITTIPNKTGYLRWVEHHFPATKLSKYIMRQAEIMVAQTQLPCLTV